MDATSASGNGFDAALKALEDLETSVLETREDKPAAKPAPKAALAIEPLGDIDFGDIEIEPEPEAQPAPIAAMPSAEVEEAAPHADPVAVSGDAPAADHATDHPVEAAAPAPATDKAATGRFGKIAIGLGLASSLLSAVGLIVAERSIMSAQLVVADARERQHQLEQSNRLIRQLEQLRDKQIELLQIQQAQVASAPVTSAELQHRMDSLQQALMARDPVTDVIHAIQSGQSDANERLNGFQIKLDRVEAAVTGHGASRRAE